jgi:hypothetical protein
MPRKNKRDPRWVSYFPEVWEDEGPGARKPTTKRNPAKRLRAS